MPHDAPLAAIHSHPLYAGCPEYDKKPAGEVDDAMAEREVDGPSIRALCPSRQ